MLDFKAKTFWVKVYKTDNTFYPEGQNQALHCWHVNSGNYGLNTQGEIVPLPGAEIVEQPTSPPTEVLVPVGINEQGTVFPSPTQFANNFVAVTKIKDMVLLKEFYVDTASYNTNVVTCNPVATASSCPVTTGLGATELSSSSVRINWTDNPASAGIEYVNNQSASAPTGDGTFIAQGTATVTITGLSNATLYHFWIRTICAGGVSAAWTSVTYTLE